MITCMVVFGEGFVREPASGMQPSSTYGLDNHRILLARDTLLLAFNISLDKTLRF